MAGKDGTVEKNRLQCSRFDRMVPEEQEANIGSDCPRLQDMK